ncbi:MAG: tRNA (adenosine(37)-N6)-dimethylallyltransferase MiaA [Oscillospiraceae bacterium]|jgi:tRNA dimethylallyltransferase|nr:tRNA (adenosine(37)-N6)-dimethylallyltransferase MiaA [Oscillospiraceae bacterium]
MPKKVFFIVGPTASGKTAFSLQLAGLLNGEVVNADSMQIYRKMDIGTGKPSKEEQSVVAHHLFDIRDPSELFSAAEYKELALEKINEVWSRGKTPIIVGGTGLYINALVNNLDFASDGNLWSKQNKLFEPFIIGLNYKDRSKLYEMINLRTDLMMKAGLLKEVQNVLSARVGITASQAIGYKEFAGFFAGEMSLCDAVALVKKNSRNYAKRQITWFRKLPNVHWICR